jgi:hypothetical protein
MSPAWSGFTAVITIGADGLVVGKPYRPEVRHVVNAPDAHAVTPGTRRRDAPAVACVASMSAASRIVDAPSSVGGRVVPDKTGVTASDHDSPGAVN